MRAGIVATGSGQDWVSTLIGPQDDFTLQFVNAGIHFELYYGIFGSLNHLRITRDRCSSLAQMPHDPDAGREMVRAFDAPLPSACGHLRQTTAMLPPLERARHLSALAMDEGAVCHECLDRDDYDSRLRRLYSVDGDRTEDRAFVALVLAMLALGQHHDHIQTERRSTVHEPSHEIAG